MRNLREYYSIKPMPASQGTVDCMNPYWDAKAGPSPENRAVQDQFQRLVATRPETTDILQRRGQFAIYESPRRVGAKNVPGEHGDFTKPHFFLEVLCHLDKGAFHDKEFCSKPIPPNWLETAADAPAF